MDQICAWLVYCWFYAWVPSVCKSLNFTVDQAFDVIKNVLETSAEKQAYIAYYRQANSSRSTF